MNFKIKYSNFTLKITDKKNTNERIKILSKLKKNRRENIEKKKDLGYF
jgi:hypothetical protein